VKIFLKWTKNILLSIIAILVIIVAISFFQSNVETKGVHNIFGYTILNVLTGSMEPTIKPGDLAIVKITDAEFIEIDDVITFQASNQTLVTHRVIDIHSNDGVISFETKGDANNVKDEELVLPNQLIGSYVLKIPKVGYIIDFIKTPLGIFITVFVILTLVVIDPIKKYLKSDENEHKKAS